MGPSLSHSSNRKKNPLPRREPCVPGDFLSDTGGCRPDIKHADASEASRMQCWTFILQRMSFLSCAKSDFGSLPVCAAFGSAYGKLEFSTTPFAHGPEVLAAVAEPDAPHSRKAAPAAERQDFTLMQPLLPEPAFLLSSPNECIS